VVRRAKDLRVAQDQSSVSYSSRSAI
jgi:hypothetical protein